MSCVALALVRSADYPEAVRVYDEGQEPRSFEEADRAALGLLWRHRRTFAEEQAISAFAKLQGRPATDEELSDTRSRWVRALMSYPALLREAVEGNCAALFEIADRSRRILCAAAHKMWENRRSGSVAGAPGSERPYAGVCPVALKGQDHRSKVIEMALAKEPVTAAMRRLRQAGVPCSGHCDTDSGGGSAEVARALGIDEHNVIKTLILEDEQHQPLIMLMHGDREVATGTLARQIGAKRIQPCAPQIVDKHFGYQVGGTSPFATRRAMPIYCERSILQLEQLYINGGKRGYILWPRSAELERLLSPQRVEG